MLFRTSVLTLILAFVTTGCANLPDNGDRTPSQSYADTQDTALGRAFMAQREAHPDRSGFLLLSSGLDAFVARAALARRAERSIDAQYYLLHHDLTGRLFVDELLKAADRGVRVRLLVDDMDLAGRDMGAAALDTHPNIELRIFNPFGRNVGRLSQFVTRFGSVTRRMHNKSFTVDGQATVLGGRNIGDEYFEADPALAFGDLDVLGIGPIAREVSESFDAYWNHALAYPADTLAAEAPDEEAVARLRAEHDAFVAAQTDSAYLRALRDSELAKRLRAGEVSLRWGTAEVVADDPEKLLADRSETELRLTESLGPYFRDLTQDLIIFSPYFVPGRDGVEFFGGLVEQGVRVRILTNSLASTDVSVVHAGYARHRRELLRAGVELYEMNRQLTSEQREDMKRFTGSSKASLHAKSFVLDRRHVFIGSLNLDPRSMVENTEIGVVIHAPEIADVMADWFDEHIESVAFKVSLERDADGDEQLRWTGYEDGEPVVFDVEPYTTVWQRMSINVMRLFPIDSQL
jgi:putative cardiolipin synthase